jgi:integrase
MKLRYYLKKQKRGPHPIYIALYQGDEDEIIYTKQRIELKDWSVKDRAPKDHNSEVSKEIEKVKASVKKIVARLELEDRTVSPFSVKVAYTEEVALKEFKRDQETRQAKSDMVTVITLAERWLKEEMFRYRKLTKFAVGDSIRAFIAYLRNAGYATLERKHLNDVIISGYERYLLEKKKLADSTHGKRMKHLKWFLKWLDFDTSRIKIRNSKKAIISLSEDELRKLEAVDVSFDKRFQKAKDMFLLGCYTGLRISDLRRLNALNTKDGFIRIRLLKNDKYVSIPIIRSAEIILSKYNHCCPKIGKEAVNEHIKTVCEKAGINDKVVIDYTRGGQRLSKTIPKHKVITSHIAGKTFITLAPKFWGLSPAEIASIVGKEVNTLLTNYFGDQGDSAREKMIQHDRTQLTVNN